MGRTSSGVHTPRGSHRSTWGHAHRRREERGGDRRTWRPRLDPRRPQALRVCMPDRARRHLWEERCALRPRLPGWRGAGGAVAMAHRARPHTNGTTTGAALEPARLPPATPSSKSSEVTPARGLGPRTPLRQAEPLAWSLGGGWRPGSRPSPPPLLPPRPRRPRPCARRHWGRAG